MVIVPPFSSCQTYVKETHVPIQDLRSNSINRSLLLAAFLMLLQVQASSAETVAEETLFNCAKAMSAPVRFRVSCVMTITPPLENGLPASEGNHEKRLEFLVSKSTMAGENLTLLESLSPTFKTIFFNVGSKNYEIFPNQKYAIDVSFRAKQGLPDTAEITDFDTKGIVSISDDGDSHCLLSVQAVENDIKIRVNRETKFAEWKRVYKRSTGELLKDYQYSNVVKNPSFASDFFSIPSNYSLEAANDNDEVIKKVGKVVLQSHKRPVFQKTLPATINPLTGKIVVPPPPGMSNKEFARLKSEAMAKLPLPKGMTESRRQELVEKTRNNLSLEPIDSVAPPKASRGYGSVWLYVGVFIALSTAVVVAIRFWMVN